MACKTGSQEPRVPGIEEFTFKEFVRTQVATTEEWHEWERVQCAVAPTTRPVLPEGPYDQFYHEQQPASPEFQLREALRVRFLERAREMLVQGEWQVWGRTGAPVTRQKLEVVDLDQSVIDLERGTIGPFRHLVVERGRPQSKTQALTSFIETVCSAAVSPGEPLKKDVIRELARKLCLGNFSTNAFAAARDEAKIDERWRKSGPR